MRSLEQQIYFERRKGYIMSAVLAVVAVAGVLLVAAAAPNALQLLGGPKRNYKHFNDQTRTALSRLLKKGYITFVTKKGKKYAQITKEGKRALTFELYRMRAHTHEKQRWDRRWRIVIFDIPEHKRHTRDALRALMKQCGFLCIQDSVWAYPYDCEEVVALIKSKLHLGYSVLYMVVEKIENDGWMRKNFDLPLEKRLTKLLFPGTSFDILSVLYK